MVQSSAEWVLPGLWKQCGAAQRGPAPAMRTYSAILPRLGRHVRQRGSSLRKRLDGDTLPVSESISEFANLQVGYIDFRAVRSDLA